LKGANQRAELFAAEEYWAGEPHCGQPEYAEEKRWPLAQLPVALPDCETEYKMASAAE